MMNADIERFIELVKTEANKEEDFVEERIKKTTLYKLLEARYNNVDELMQMALKKANWFERLRDAMEFEWKRAVNQRVYNESDEDKSERLIFYIEFDSCYKDIVNKCKWRYGRDKMLKLAEEIIKKYPSNGILMGKFTNEVMKEWRG